MIGLQRGAVLALASGVSAMRLALIASRNDDHDYAAVVLSMARADLAWATWCLGGATADA